MTSSLADAVSLETLADDPFPIVAELRARQPVAWAPSMDRWLVSRRDLILEVITDQERFTTDHRRSPIRDTFGPQMLSTDGVEHRRHRGPFAPPFRPGALRETADASVEARARDLVSALTPGDDLTRATSTMAVATVLDILGITGMADIDTVISWYDDLAAALANVTALADVAARGRETAATFRAALDNFGSANALGAFPEPKLGEGPAALGRGERANNALVILFGGIETTQSALLNALWALAVHEEAQRGVRDDRARLESAVEESLRWEPAVMTLTRFALTDTELGREHIQVDSGIECLIPGANRDPATFEDPDRYDISRPNAGDHFTFGYGRHHCLGAHLARMEAVAFIGALLDRSPDGFALSNPDQSGPRGHEFRRPPRLALTW